MNIDDIRNLLKDCEIKPIDVKQFYAVLLPLINIDGEAHILYEVRAMHLKSQPGEVCFPGGRIEADETPKEAAVRETCEELNLQPEDIDIHGPLDYLVKTGGYVMYPYFGGIKTYLHDIEFNKGEVEEVFTIPISYLVDYMPDEHMISYRVHTEADFPYEKINGGVGYKWRSIGYSMPFYEYDGKVIWGMTARVTRNFIERLKNGG